MDGGDEARGILVAVVVVVEVEVVEVVVELAVAFGGVIIIEEEDGGEPRMGDGNGIWRGGKIEVLIGVDSSSIFLVSITQ